jgi:tetratricopeptide (TPR) repeat protein
MRWNAAVLFLFLCLAASAARAEDADDLVAKGLEAMSGRDAVAAMSAFSEALERDPSHAQAAYQRGLLLLMIGEPRQAIADFTTAALSDPTLGKAIARRGEAKATLKNDTGAEEDFALAIRTSPEDFEVYVVRATYRLKQGALTDAIADLELAKLRADEQNAARIDVMIGKLRSTAQP